MIVNIIRGQNQIGGSIIEISTDKTKIVFDAGMNLDESEEIEIPEIDGLFCGKKKYDAVFISHYHSDHIGLLDYIVDNIPVYIGERAYKIVKAANNYRGRQCRFSPQFICEGKEIQIKDIKITPILCDHSAFDSYMFLIEADEKKVLYTGDFRANGRLDYDNLLLKLPVVDALITEGTTLSREDVGQNVEEETLEDIAVKALSKYQGPAFVIMSAMNIDRLITMNNAAKRTGRAFLEDIYTAKIAKASEESALIPDKNTKVFMTGGDKQYQMLSEFADIKIGKTAIAKEKFLMCIRPSMKNYLAKLNEICSFEDGILFYGMWKGYLERDDMREFVEFMKVKGVNLHILHTSGHADAKTLENLIKDVSPKAIIPVHTENAEWFSKYKDAEIIFDCKGFRIRWWSENE